MADSYDSSFNITFCSISHVCVGTRNSNIKQWKKNT
jgi:hypothetical protein